MKQNPIRLKDYLNDETNKSFKILITAVSYEKRGISSVRSIINNLEIEKAILILFNGKNYLSNKLQEKWEEQKKHLINIFKENKIEYIEFACDSVFFYDSIEKIIEFVGHELPIVINITTLPKNYILRFAKDFDNEQNIFYYHRTVYRKPTKDELNIGIREIVPIEGFEGFMELNKEDLLVLILGYEGHRALSFISKFSSYRILPLISIPNEGNSMEDKLFYENDIFCNKNLLRKHSVLKNKDETFYTISSLNHINFYIELESIIEDYIRNNKDNICISPMGTRAQTLGLYLYWRKHPEIQIVYSVPIERFSIAVADGESEGWIYKLPSMGNKK